ncbi:Uu.00g072030.m01.CDS01 [Anthostomella pinea]|uniref:Uu.00g072030.m01.CDS01 n=1 Tax=Anthostomella pinea TaxID=933095 RepID=A0AAI8VW75_9PEZI|nr:Uu.00g072030.m01.CDS01 [Anthostomella pinea]
MHRALIFLQLSLWITSIHALLPLASEGHGEASKRSTTTGATLAKPNGFVTFKMVQKASGSGGSITDLVTRASSSKTYKHRSRASSRTINGESTVAARDNDYAVDVAQDPTMKNSAGVDQDGTDYSYFVEAKLGSDGKPLYMLLDTGASTTWVMGSGCTSDACKKHNSYGPNDSKTYVDTGKTYSVEYGTGKVGGHVIEDTISVAGLAVTVSFGVANTTSDEFTEFPFDGILGLSMSPNTWLSAVKDANLIDANVFGISLSRHADGTNDGEIAVGAPNPDKYDGDISYASIVSGSTWTIPMDDIMVGGKSAGVTGRHAYIDTGTSFVFGPPDDVKSMYNMIPGSSSSDGSTYTVPCDSDASVALTFAGKSWTISSKDLLSAPDGNGHCAGNVYGMEYVAGAWLVGDVFLKNVYSVFDVDQGRIGFAAKQTTTSTTTGSSTATSTGTASSTASGGLNGQETPTGTAAADTVSATPTASGKDSSGARFAGDMYAIIACLFTIIAMIV